MSRMFRAGLCKVRKRMQVTPLSPIFISTFDDEIFLTFTARDVFGLGKNIYSLSKRDIVIIPRDNLG